MLSLPNLLTLSRIIAVPLLVFLLWRPAPVDYAITFVALLRGRHNRLSRRLSRPRLGEHLAARPVPRPHRRQDHGRCGNRHADFQPQVKPGTGNLGTPPHPSSCHPSARNHRFRTGEYLAGLQVSVPVSALAKWKTTLQLVALGALILGGGAAPPAVGAPRRTGMPVGGGGADLDYGLRLSARRPPAHGIIDSVVLTDQGNSFPSITTRA